jgi:hypothetical protein
MVMSVHSAADTRERGPGLKRVASQGRAVVLADLREAQQRSKPRSAEVTASPLYGVAMLKIAMELKKPGAPGLDEILQGVLARMRIPEREFREFLAQNGGLLRIIAGRKGF